MSKSPVADTSGPEGDAATIAVGTTTTGLPGSDAIVVNSGSDSAAVFDFTIPEGEQGVKGDIGPSGTVESVVAGTGVDVDSVDPANPTVSSPLAATATQPGDNLSTLTNDEGFAPTIGALKHEVVAALPGTPDPTTIYYVTE